MFYKKIAKENKKLYGCSVPFHPQFFEKVSGEEIKICDNVTAGSKAHANFRGSRDARLSAGDTPCAEFDIFLGLPFIDNEDNDVKEAFIRLYIKSKIKIKRIVIHYDLTTFAAEIGGYIGMVLGVSLVDLAVKFRSVLLNSMQ